MFNDRISLEQFTDGEDFIRSLYIGETESFERVLIELAEKKERMMELEALIEHYGENTQDFSSFFLTRDSEDHTLNNFIKQEQEEFTRVSTECKNLQENLDSTSEKIKKLESLMDILQVMRETKESHYIKDNYGNRITSEIVDSVFSIQLKERKRIARILHDDVLQDLVYLTHKTELAEKYMDQDITRSKEELHLICDGLHSDIDNVRNIYYVLIPIEKDDSLSQKLENRIDNYRTFFKGSIDFIYLINSIIPYPYKICIYRVTLDLINNAVMYSDALNIQVTLDESKESYTISVTDNGEGFTVDSKSTNKYGLKIIEDRVNSLKGKLKISSNKENGTIANVIIPKDVCTS